jgi:hypothetical protein
VLQKAVVAGGIHQHWMEQKHTLCQAAEESSCSTWPPTYHHWRGLSYLANIIVCLHHFLDARSQGVRFAAHLGAARSEVLLKDHKAKQYSRLRWVHKGSAAFNMVHEFMAEFRHCHLGDVVCA